MERQYKCLSSYSFVLGDYSLLPIRDIDKFDIMNWRNQQINILRQSKPLTEGAQANYFNTVVNSLFEYDKPDQLLFSFLQHGVCIGYGGLVHINWTDKNAEVSFIMKTELEKDFFAVYWSNYLTILFDVAFRGLKFHKIYTYAFDLRPHLYPLLAGLGFIEEARLKEHCYFEEKYIDVLIHSKINEDVNL